MATKALRRQERKAAKRAGKMNKQRRPFNPLNDTQAFYMECLLESDQVFAVGGAGTGKTYIAARHAIRELMMGNKERVIITRPTVAKYKHKLGFLPGNLEEKLQPWLIPLTEAMREEVHSVELSKLMRNGSISFISFEHMRGRSIRDAVVILDEAQNCDLADLRLFLTRIGENTQVIVCGDTDQVDIPDSGLSQVVKMILENEGISADLVEFEDDDVVRSDIAREWVRAFSDFS